MDRVIIHSDANCFYASVEMLYHPEFAGKPLAVGGDPEARHGIVLTANYIAKKHGVKTGMALWQARQACPDVIFVPPRMDLYLKFSSMLREIYGEYTDKIEPYGCDEAWLDVSDSSSLKGDGRKIADEISARVKKELGITVSEGISWNKIYAKLGSDYKKPDAITEFNRENYKSLIWKLPASDLLYVGRSTNRTLSKYGIHTIGDLACTDPDFLLKTLGKMGLVIHSFANGWDESPVATEGYSAPIKSIGNSTTTPRDLENDLDVQIIFMALAESVSARLRKHGFKCNTVAISIRDNSLYHFFRQMHLREPTDITDEIMNAAIRKALNDLIKEHDLPPVVFHSLRHTSVTYKLKLNGGDIKAVQGDSGHSQINMVTDVYSHIIDDDRRKNAELFEQAFYEKKNLDPSMHANVAGKTVELPTNVDAELLAKVLSNPEMAALLSTLAKSLESK